MIETQIESQLFQQSPIYDDNYKVMSYLAGVASVGEEDLKPLYRTAWETDVKGASLSLGVLFRLNNIEKQVDYNSFSDVFLETTNPNDGNAEVFHIVAVPPEKNPINKNKSVGWIMYSSRKEEPMGFLTDADIITVDSPFSVDINTQTEKFVEEKKRLQLGSVNRITVVSKGRKPDGEDIPLTTVVNRYKAAA